MSDSTNPNHYVRLKPEPIDVIRAWSLSFNLGNVVKYIARHGHKPDASALDDLRKAATYLAHEIAALEERDSPKPMGVTSSWADAEYREMRTKTGNRCLQCEAFVETLEPWREATLDEKRTRPSVVGKLVAKARCNDCNRDGLAIHWSAP